jgi:hypothetical protein
MTNDPFRSIVYGKKYIVCLFERNSQANTWLVNNVIAAGRCHIASMKYKENEYGIYIESIEFKFEKEMISKNKKTNASSNMVFELAVKYRTSTKDFECYFSERMYFFNSNSSTALAIFCLDGWELKRLVWIGFMRGKEDACPFSILPKDIIKIIIGFITELHDDSYDLRCNKRKRLIRDIFMI